MVAILQGWHHDHGSSSRQAILMQLCKETRGKEEEVKAGISDCRQVLVIAASQASFSWMLASD